VGIFIRRRHGAWKFTNITKLSIVGLVISLSNAFVNTIWAVYLDSFFNNMVIVGFLSSFLTIVSFLASFFFIPVIEKRDKSKLFAFSLLFFVISYLLFAFNNNVYLMVSLAVFISALYSLKIASYGLLIKDNSSKGCLSRNEGLIYTSLNLSWVIGPLVAGYVLADFGFRGVYILSALCIAIGLLVFRSSKIKVGRKTKKVDKHILKNFISFFKKKERIFSYLLGAGVTAWWSLIYLFMPLRIIHFGLNELWIGYFFFAVAVPLIFFEYYFSKLAGIFGFRKIFKTGYFLVTILVVPCFFISNIYIVMALLVLASIGMAMLEPTTEAYFFDILKGDEEYRFYGPYNTAVDFGDVVVRFLASILLICLSFQFIYLLFGALMFSLFLLSSKIKNVIEKKKSR